VLVADVKAGVPGTEIIVDIPVNLVWIRALQAGS